MATSGFDSVMSHVHWVYCAYILLHMSPPGVPPEVKSIGDKQRKLQTCLEPDIEQPLTGRNLIKPTDLFPKQAKDFDLHLVQPFNQVVNLALHGHADAMNPFKQLEDPT